ncbi:MAG TPA: response regulator [Salinivirgaceae bacterium]|nr:response regulator [Salinivirgaceae bacterium]
MQKLITTLCVRFINKKPDLLKEEIKLSLQEIGEFSGVDRVYIFSYDFVKDVQTNTFEWCAKGILSKKENLTDIQNALTPELTTLHKQGKISYISDVSLLNDDSALKKLLIKESVKSLITIPLYFENTCFGYIGLDSVKKHRQWNKDEISTLKLFADLLVNVRIKEKYGKCILEAKYEAEQSEKKIRDLIEHSPIGILNILPNGFITELNEAAIKILGSPSKEHTKKINILTTKPLIDCGFVDNFTQCVKHKKLTTDETKYHSIWSKDSYVRYYLNPILVNDIVQSVYVSIEDITEIYEARLKLVKLKEKAEESDRLKSTFLANMSHEIRTPMNGIIGFAELLKEPDIPEEKKRHFIEIINTNAYYLLDLISDIIDISKIESGQVDCDPSDINLNLLIDEIYNMWSPVAKKKNIKLTSFSTLNNTQSGITTDALKLKQIIINLISNAIKFSDYGEVEYGYYLKNRELLFFVKDTGKGIPAECVDKIFERFYQLDNLPQDSRTGSGLGLSISSAYVQLLGGKIWLDTELGKGSTFYFTIPYKPTTTQLIYTDLNNHENINWSNKTILIAEDDISNTLYLTETLRKTKVNIISVKTGQEAIEEVKSGRYIDLILMDIKMPVIDGLTATKEILKIDPNIPIIAQTAYAFIEDIERAKKAGCIDFIPKPMKSAELISKITKHLQ